MTTKAQERSYIEDLSNLLENIRNTRLVANALCVFDHKQNTPTNTELALSWAIGSLSEKLDTSGSGRQNDPI